MKILIACEYSGNVREAFKKRGHNVWSCDLLPTEIPGKHYQGNVLKILNKNNWDMLIGFPPCTYLSNVGARHLFPIEDLSELKKKRNILRLEKKG